MSKAIFFGDDYYTWLGIKNILYGTVIYSGVKCYPIHSPNSLLSSLNNNDYLIINPKLGDVLKYAKEIRDLSLRSTFILFVFTDAETFTVFQTVCGLRMHFLDHSQSLDNLYQRVNQLINSKASPIRPLANAVTVNEFDVMMMLSRGWSLSKIANAAHKSEKTIGSYKSNIAKKIGCSNTHLKYIFSCCL